jgi:RNA polymerase sigma factor for flagellar operon FliA
MSMTDRVGSDQISDIDDLWRRFKESGDGQIRESLILHYAPLVKFVAGRVAVGLPRSVDQNDLASYGVFGLIDAIDKFEPERGFKFETYAINRIKGAILDELRSLDWVPRSVRAKAREIERSIGELEHRLQRAPTDEELAEHMETDVASIQDDLAEISQLGIAALDQTVGTGDTAITLKDLVSDPSGTSPEAAFQAEETRRLLVDSINRLPDRERLVVTLYYYEGLTLAEIGDVLGVTESRVCQIHAKTVMSLRNRLAEPPIL